MRLLFSLHVEIMCDHSQLIIITDHTSPPQKKKIFFFFGGGEGRGKA